MAIVSFLFSLISLCFAFVPVYWCLYVAFGLAIIGYAFGLAGVIKKKNNLRRASWFGLIVSAISVTITLLFYFYK